MQKILLMCLFLVATGSSFLRAQDREVSGTVGMDEGTEGFAGATVLIKGTGIGTVTDARGEYRLKIPASGTTLIFSAVGMEIIEDPINGRTTIDAQLKSDSKQLNQVVITALGSKGNATNLLRPFQP